MTEPSAHRDSVAAPEHHEGHGHGQGHGHGEQRHDHGSARGWRRLWGAIRHTFVPHSHDSADRVDSALETSRRGMRALIISFGALMVTAIAQAALVVVTGSVALLGDTIHNFADALTAIPLGIAFLLGRRAVTRRFTYGLGRSEDIAGLVIVVLIAFSAGAAGYAAIRRIIEPQDVQYLGLVAGAGVVGFLGNELVARYRIRVGREIGSAALVADGLHARTDALTSLVVVIAALGTWLGIPYADPIVGLGITVMIVFVLRDAAKEVFSRLLDAIDPDLVDKAEQVLADTPGVREVSAVRMRWIGHALHAEVVLTADPDLDLQSAHAIAVDAEHNLRHGVTRLTGVTVHVDPHPTGADGQVVDHHAALAHHVTPRGA